MTVVTWNVFQAYDNTVSFTIVYDSPMISEDPNDPTGNTYIAHDPTATDLVSAVMYKNFSQTDWQMIMGAKVYTAIAGTPLTTINIPHGQQFRLDQSPTVTFEPVTPVPQPTGQAR